MRRPNITDGDFETVGIEASIGCSGHWGEYVGGRTSMTSEFPDLVVFDQEIFMAGNNGINVIVGVGFRERAKAILIFYVDT